MKKLFILLLVICFAYTAKAEEPNYFNFRENFMSLEVQEFPDFTYNHISWKQTGAGEIGMMIVDYHLFFGNNIKARNAYFIAA